MISEIVTAQRLSPRLRGEMSGRTVRGAAKLSVEAAETAEASEEPPEDYPIDAAFSTISSAPAWMLTGIAASRDSRSV